MPELSHTQLLLVAGICLVPGVFQLLADDRVHWMWLLLAVAGAVFAVVMW
jgi:nucleoside recognition membrane protein YjiH